MLSRLDHRRRAQREGDRVTPASARPRRAPREPRRDDDPHRRRASVAEPPTNRTRNRVPSTVMRADHVAALGREAGRLGTSSAIARIARRPPMPPTTSPDDERRDAAPDDVAEDRADGPGAGGRRRRRTRGRRSRAPSRASVSSRGDTAPAGGRVNPLPRSPWRARAPPRASAGVRRPRERVLLARVVRAEERERADRRPRRRARSAASGPASGDRAPASALSAASQPMAPSATITRSPGSSWSSRTRYGRQVACSSGVGLFAGGAQRTAAATRVSRSVEPVARRAG